MKLFQSLVILLAIGFFAACGGPKIVPATPATKPVNVQGSSENLHSMLILLSKYKKYEILSDDGKSNAKIKYDRKDKQGNLILSITYDLTNTESEYTMSYADSQNMGYADGQINGNYLRYINMFDGTLKRMYKDPAYLSRMKNIVAGLNPDGTPKGSTPAK